VCAQVEAGRRVFVDDETCKFDLMPPCLSHDRVTFIQMACSEASTVGDDVFTFRTSRPIKVYVAFRSDLPVPAWVPERFELTPHVVMTKVALFHRAYAVYESKELYIPGAVRWCGWHQAVVRRTPAPSRA
jgi:hypothetical protein